MNTLTRDTIGQKVQAHVFESMILRGSMLTSIPAAPTEAHIHRVWGCGRLRLHCRGHCQRATTTRWAHTLARMRRGSDRVFRLSVRVSCSSWVRCLEVSTRQRAAVSEEKAAVTGEALA